MTKDEIFKEAVLIFTKLGSDSTKKERQEAKRQEWEVLKKLKDVDREEYEFFRSVRDH
jgi:hypothetical protein